MLGSVRLSTQHGARAECLIARMLGGELVPLPSEQRDQLPPRLQHVVASHEVAGGATLELDAHCVHLFELELLEQSPDAPGLDDPVHLYGALSGPFPAQPGAPSCVRRGQLTVTRGDLLAGLCRGVRGAFRLPAESGVARGTRAISAVLPGDRDGVIQRGEGLVLAFPLLPADLALDEASNELMVAQLIHDVLAMLRDDARASHPSHPFAQLALPVPSRAALESRLESDGWAIEGDVATKKPTEQGGLGGFVAQVLHPIVAEQKTLPPEASLDQFVALAESLLPNLPGWPGPRAHALAARIALAPSSSLRTATAGVRTPTRPEPAPAQEQAVTARAPRPRVSSERDEWMKDFVSTPPPTSQKKKAPDAPRPKPRLSPTSKTATPARIPDWMKDFDVDDHD